MTYSALVFITMVWTFVLGMVLFCYTKLLRSQRHFGAGDGEEKEDSHERRT